MSLAEILKSANAQVYFGEKWQIVPDTSDSS
jgi:hypothetical protein